MHIIEISGKAGSGKSGALQKLAGSNPIHQGRETLGWNKGTVGTLVAELFVDEVHEYHLQHLRNLAGELSRHLRIYVVIAA